MLRNSLILHYPSLTTKVGAAKLCSFFLFLMLLASPIQAQIGVKISLGRVEFLQFESIPLKVTLSNLRGETVHLNELAGESPWLTFQVMNTTDEEIPAADRTWTPPPFILQPGEVKSIHVDLVPYYLIRESGSYRVSAHVLNGKKNISSGKLNFMVVGGATLWEQEFAAPAPINTKGSKEPRPRHYSLVLHRAKGKRVLYARITNPETGRIYCTVPVGNMVNYGEPTARIDRAGDFHSFHQAGTRIFHYSHFTSEGKSLGTRYFSNISSPPQMISDSQGETEIIGGEEVFPGKNGDERIIPTARVTEPPKEIQEE
jgi:hypothetical protein